MFPLLDDYEDINPLFPEDNEYIRAVVKVNSREIEMYAYAYLYTKDVLSLKRYLQVITFLTLQINSQNKQIK